MVVAGTQVVACLLRVALRARCGVLRLEARLFRYAPDVFCGFPLGLLYGGIGARVARAGCPLKLRQPVLVAAPASRFSFVDGRLQVSDGGM